MRCLKLLTLITLSSSILSACVSDDGSAEAGDEQGSTAAEADAGSEGATETGGTTSTDGTSSTTGEACTPDLEALRAELFEPNCALAGCHDAMTAAGALDLSAADLEAELVGAPSGTCDGWVRVIPQDPDNSLLWTKLADQAPCGQVMPPSGPLPPGQVECVRNWIDNLEGMSCETCGGDACVDLQTDNQNCGGCGEVCPMGVPCSAGACQCPEGEELCGDLCIDVSDDPLNCGGCGRACAPDKVCFEGICADTCGALTDCGGSCVDISDNPDHCGTCNNACGQGNACVDSGCECPGDGVSFAAEVEPLLGNRCTGMGCHSFPAPAAFLDLSPGNAYDSLVSVASSQCADRLLVAPGQVGASYLMDKVTGTNLCFGTQMPKAGAPLSAEETAAISEWICRGAQNN